MTDSVLEPVISITPAQMSLDTIKDSKMGPSELESGNLESLQPSLTSTSSTKDRWMRIMVKRNKSFLAQNINQVGHEITKMKKMFPPPEYPREVLKAFFPRSVVYEIEYKMKQAELKIEEALRKEREALAQKVKMKLIKENEDGDKKDKNDEEFDKLKKEKEPFWYKDEEEMQIAQQNPADYDVNKFLPAESPEQKNVAEEIGITEPDNYIPGQIGGKPHQSLEQSVQQEKADELEKQKKPLLVLSPSNRTDELENQKKPQPVPYEKHEFRSTPKEITESDKNIKKFADQCHPKRIVVPGEVKCTETCIPCSLSLCSDPTNLYDGYNHRVW